MRIGDLEFALERGRIYRIGEAAQCDVRTACGEPIALLVELVDGDARVTQQSTGAVVLLRSGGSARLSGIECAVVEDVHGAAILPDPMLVRGAIAPDGQRVAQAIGAIESNPNASPRAIGTETTFADMLANELRRAPWFALSLVLHALLFLIAWIVFGAMPPEKEPPPRYGYEATIAPEPDAMGPATEVPVTAETLDAIDPEPQFEPPGGSEPIDSPPPELTEASPNLLARIGTARVPSTSASDGAGSNAGQGTGSGSGIGAGTGDVMASGKGSAGFRKTVSELRRSGLEIVFVFDSTGSMGSSIRATKDGIANMLDVLRALVPDARFSLVTYRDKGQGEEYLVRTLPLDRDFYAAVNWMQTVEADGGGDAPEAVLAGLREAFRQDFRRGARRVVVLAGDAPPHPRDLRAVREQTLRFAAAPTSAVHALLTSGKHSTAADTFADIAKAGRGECFAIEDQKLLLRHVLTLAFGAAFERDLDEVQQRLAAERSSPPTWARDLARRGGEDLAKALGGDSIPSALVHALLRHPSRAAMLTLVGVLADPSSGNPGMQAAAHVLQRALELPQCPIDAQNPRPIPQALAAQLRQRALSLPE